MILVIDRSGDITQWHKLDIIGTEQPAYFVALFAFVIKCSLYIVFALVSCWIDAAVSNYHAMMQCSLKQAEELNSLGIKVKFDCLNLTDIIEILKINQRYVNLRIETVIQFNRQDFDNHKITNIMIALSEKTQENKAVIVYHIMELIFNNFIQDGLPPEIVTILTMLSFIFSLIPSILLFFAQTYKLEAKATKVLAEKQQLINTANWFVIFYWVFCGLYLISSIVIKDKINSL